MRDIRPATASRRMRAAVVVVALYGLVLQAFLSAMGPGFALPFADGRVPTVLCQHDDRGGQDPGPPIAGHGTGCCTAACFGPGALLCPPAAALAGDGRLPRAAIWSSVPSVVAERAAFLAFRARAPPLT